MSSVTYQKGEQNFRRLFGDEVVDQVLKNVTEFDKEMHRLLFEYCFGEIWSREGLSLKQRRLNTLCMMAAMNRSWEFEVHFRGAVRDGVPLEELRETLLQIAVYAGIPAGLEAFRIANRVLKEEGLQE